MSNANIYFLFSVCMFMFVSVYEKCNFLSCLCCREETTAVEDGIISHPILGDLVLCGVFLSLFGSGSASIRRSNFSFSVVISFSITLAACCLERVSWISSSVLLFHCWILLSVSWSPSSFFPCSYQLPGSVQWNSNKIQNVHNIGITFSIQGLFSIRLLVRWLFFIKKA